MPTLGRREEGDAGFRDLLGLRSIHSPVRRIDQGRQRIEKFAHPDPVLGGHLDRSAKPEFRYLGHPLRPSGGFHLVCHRNDRCAGSTQGIRQRMVGCADSCAGVNDNQTGIGFQDGFGRLPPQFCLETLAFLVAGRVQHSEAQAPPLGKAPPGYRGSSPGYG